LPVDALPGLALVDDAEQLEVGVAERDHPVRGAEARVHAAVEHAHSRGLHARARGIQIAHTHDHLTDRHAPSLIAMCGARRSVRAVDDRDRFPVSLTGDRIRLREVRPGDAAAALAWAAYPAFFRYLAFEPVASVAEEAEYLRGLEAQAHARPRRQFHLGVVWRESDELIGLARLGITTPQHREADIGYGLRLDWTGEGIATEAAELLLQFGFVELGLHRIFAFHHPDNIASRRVLEKIGMQREGRLRENLLEHGRWRDSVLHAVLEHEWRSRRREPGR
jgi:[ribosomal protein S5]-alanine N-acetyltransferase